ncbi:MAG: hypothetical protein ABJE10_20715 [bacterium]
MIVRTRASRFGWLFAAVFQLLLPAVASVADGRADAESMGVASRVHVEATGTTGCPRVHPQDCVVCRVLATSATTTPSASVAAPVVRQIEATISDAHRPACIARFPGDPPQRAPPV